ncbi:Spy/CpxP family protein refolding chaperone [Oceanobacter antarcticus]|uniref:Spy/CpxP family protein refolding chaperone n=1 Tax=Oceanobacter antarcticus TaxID=3133425 RepID=A0ABW8NJV0_9GAMM
MINAFTNSRKALAGRVLAILLSAASVAAAADDDRPERGDGMKGHACFDGRDGGGRYMRQGHNDEMRPGMMTMGPGMMPMGRMGEGRELVWRDLDLTDEQRADMTGIRDKMRKDHWAVTGAMMDIHNTIRDLYAAEKFDEKALNKAYGKLAELQQQMFLIGTQAKTKMMALLSSEQRQQLMDKKHALRD